MCRLLLAKFAVVSGIGCELVKYLNEYRYLQESMDLNIHV